MEPARKQEIVSICLDTFVKKGLAHTPTRDLCSALNLNSGGVFYYFKTKDEIVIACAEEAILRIEENLMGAVLKEIEAPRQMIDHVCTLAKTMQPLMQFFVSVCSCAKYKEAIRPILEGLTKRLEQYAKVLADTLQCETKELTPYLYIGINTMLSYMLFGQEHTSAPQLDLIHNVLVSLLKKRDKN